ncbi:DUF6517 family protein [Halorubrum rutilum]|uniref:DUF6517 family protein n=1 Tax=Halorubrum rutilum TaxID=1364933 RepID=A0ABD6AFD9_9EURY|nr:DUF6517 family protein [Halorubrum rutilum]
MTGGRAPRSRRAVLTGAVAALATTAGCGLLPEEREPIEASATEPAYLPEPAASSGGYAETLSTETTLEVTVRVDLSGDVELTSTREVIATAFRRGYEADDGRRFGVVTAPAVTVIDRFDVVRDPVTELGDARVVELATGLSVADVSGRETAGSRPMLGGEAAVETATATADGGAVSLRRARVRAGEDAVTAVFVSPDGADGDAPFGAVARDA